MRPKLRTLWRYRPRVLTLILLTLLAAPIVPANFSSDLGDSKHLGAGFYIRFISYGWPLNWHRYVLFYTTATVNIVDWQWNAMRLAANLAMWLAMLAPPALACEWALRRYRPRLRCSLRTMLVAIGVLALLCAAIASARRRANLQDPLIAAIHARWGQVWVDHWGPKWLELVGADRFCWSIIGAEFRTGLLKDNAAEDNEEILLRLGALPRLEMLWLASIEDLPPRMAERVAGMRQLRSLGVGLWGDDEQSARGWLDAIGRLSQLEHLELEGVIPDDGLEYLVGLADLKSLSLDTKLYDQPRPLGRHLPVLSRLEFLDLPGTEIDDRDLRHLSAFPRLKSLRLMDSVFTDPDDLSGLRSFPSLEELAIGTPWVSPLGIESLAAIPKLKTLHLHSFPFIEGTPDVDMAIGDQQKVLVPPDDLADYEAALKVLRRLKPGIVIDNAEMNSPWQQPFSAESRVSVVRPTWLPSAEWIPGVDRAKFRTEAAKLGIPMSF